MQQKPQPNKKPSLEQLKQQQKALENQMEVAQSAATIVDFIGKSVFGMMGQIMGQQNRIKEEIEAKKARKPCSKSKSEESKT